MSVSSKEPHLLLAGLYRDGVSLELDTPDLCFLTALYLRAEQDGLASIEEDLALDVFDQVCDLVEPGVENPRKRATHTIQRLRNQRMLARVDATGVVSAGEYALTGLATTIVKSILEDEQLSRESLSLLTGAVISILGQIRSTADRAGKEMDWRAQVVAPLRITVGDLVGGIERRQRGLDGQQEEVQRQIGELLQTDWFGAVEQCQILLDTMAATLEELNEVLLRDSTQIQLLLQEIQHAAAVAVENESEEAAQRVGEQVDRMVAWGASRQHAWSGYYQYVHRFLRDVVRLDPDRALSQRLVEQIRNWSSNAFAFFTASDAKIHLLRPVSTRRESPPVGRPHENREEELSTVVAVDQRSDLESFVLEALSQGNNTLAAVTRSVLQRLDEPERYRATGRIAAIVAKHRIPRPALERPWVGVTDSFEIEDWTIDSTPEGKGE